MLWSKYSITTPLLIFWFFLMSLKKALKVPVNFLSSVITLPDERVFRICLVREYSVCYSPKFTHGKY